MTKEYDKYGNIISETQPYKSGETPVVKTTEYYINYIDTTNSELELLTSSYCSYQDTFNSNMYMLGNEIRNISPLGIVETHYTDNNNIEYKIEYKDGTNTKTIRKVYDTMGRKLKEISPAAYKNNDCMNYEKISVYESKINSTNYYYFSFEDTTDDYSYATEYEYKNERGAGYNHVISITKPKIDGERDITLLNYEKDNIIEKTDPDGQVYIRI